jgi:hypothetical protein
MQGAAFSPLEPKECGRWARRGFVGLSETIWCKAGGPEGTPTKPRIFLVGRVDGQVLFATQGLPKRMQGVVLGTLEPPDFGPRARGAIAGPFETSLVQGTGPGRDPYKTWDFFSGACWRPKSFLHGRVFPEIRGWTQKGAAFGSLESMGFADVPTGAL